MNPTVRYQRRKSSIAARRIRHSAPIAGLLLLLASACSAPEGEATESSAVGLAGAAESADTGRAAESSTVELTGVAGSADTGRAAESSTVELTGVAASANDEPTAASQEPSAPQPDDASSGACPRGTLEVRGLYCTDLIHHCIRGGKNHRFEPTDDDPEPYYCDQFRVGYARCLGKEEPKHFCIDEYEYPNQKGALPRVMVNWFEAKQLCEQRGERLCGDDEWTLACEGPDRLAYPYGWQRDPSACNIDHAWLRPNDSILGSRTAPPEVVEREVERLSQRVPSGSMPGCRSPYGVMDMAGNVDEWAVNVTLHGKPYRSTFKGGHWLYGARNRCRPVTATHDETTAYYAEGFRCCADARPSFDGK